MDGHLRTLAVNIHAVPSMITLGAALCRATFPMSALLVSTFIPMTFSIRFTSSSEYDDVAYSVSYHATITPLIKLRT